VSNKIPAEVEEYARCYMNGYDCSDNLRFYVVGDEKSLKEYNRIRNRGCCGFVDWVRHPYLVDGKEYYFGFNYGH